MEKINKKVIIIIHLLSMLVGAFFHFYFLQKDELGYIFLLGFLFWGYISLIIVINTILLLSFNNTKKKLYYSFLISCSIATYFSTLYILSDEINVRGIVGVIVIVLLVCFTSIILNMALEKLLSLLKRTIVGRKLCMRLKK